MAIYPTPPASPGPGTPDDRLGMLLADRIRLTEVLGVGAYGTVYKGRDIITGVEYAVKALNKLGLDPRQQRFLSREIRLHYEASQHPHVVTMEQILDTPECLFVILEYCPEGDLFSKITEDGDYVADDWKAKTVFLQILDAVRHLHAIGIYHRDLKPENILVKNNGWNVKLADFGLATQDPITSDFGCGSTFYMSPECHQPNPRPSSCYSSAPNDVWALGVILVNLTCGRNPWKRAALDDSTFRAFMRDPGFLQTILPISDRFNAILQRIFEVDPRRRITLEELREIIVFCPQLNSNKRTFPDTPPQSPLDSPSKGDNPSESGLDPVPVLEQLPGPATQPNNCQLRTAPINIPSPPRSNIGHYHRHTKQFRPMAPVGYNPCSTQAGFLSSWSRSMLTNFGQHAYGRNVPVF